VFLVDGAHSLQAACHRAGFDFRYEKYGNLNAVERIFREIKRRIFFLVIVLATSIQQPQKHGPIRPVSSKIHLTKHDTGV